MTPEKTALTKFTTSKRKVNRLFTLKKITTKDIEGLNKRERDCLAATTNEILPQLKGKERDSFIDKIELIVPESTKNQLWEHNHLVIGSAISKLMGEYGFMPPKNAIAEETGLSRQTVAKHFKEYKAHPEHAAQMEQFKFMAPNILANVYKFAIKGDMRAARLYFEMVGAVNKQQPNTIVNEQNHYIQINNTILSQENLRQLSAEQLNQIESIITNREDK
jgi:hypothetical protein